MDFSGKVALKRTQGTACGAGGCCIDEVSDRLGLGEIELAVFEGAAGKFPWLGKSRTQFEAAGKQQLHNDGTTMPLEFQDVVTGK